MKRRDFLKVATSGALSLGLGSSLASNIRLLANEEPKPAPNYRWYKGNFHCHSQWSDGKDLPEIVVDGYKERGYEFFCLTDHNVFQAERLRFDGFAMNFTPQDATPFKDENSFWKKVAPQDGWPNLTEEHIQRARDRFGADSVVTKKTAEGTYVRMKTYKELTEQFEEKGRFLMAPGFEMTAQYVHVNLINITEPFFLEGPDMGKLLVDCYDKAIELYGDNPADYLFTVNHPMWQYYNLQPSHMFSRPNMRFLEVLNNNTSWKYIPEAWTPESFWDIVNAYRAVHDQPKVYATGTDDSHGVFRPDCLAFHSWTRVRSSELTIPAIIKGLNSGASYVSDGLEFADVQFDGDTLAVKLDPQVEGEYRIEFVGTKKDYDDQMKICDVDGSDGRPARKIECYSKEIGKVLETVDGLEGSYTLKKDDLYVRAKAYRVGAGCVNQGTGYDISPLTADSAWTQPYRQGDKL